MRSQGLAKAIEKIGIQGVATACGVTYHASYKWSDKGRLPRTEYTGETQYAEKIVAACRAKGFEVTQQDLLALVPVDLADASGAAA